MRTEPSAESPKLHAECFLCREGFGYGPHQFRGDPVPAWGIVICDQCRRMNWDGVAAHCHPRLMKHLADHGIEVQRNAKGFVVIPG